MISESPKPNVWYGDLQLSDDSNVDPNYEVTNDSESSSNDDHQNAKSKGPRQCDSKEDSLQKASTPGNTRKGREMKNTLRNTGKANTSCKGKQVEVRKMGTLTK